jgi:hypothetical protein
VPIVARMAPLWQSFSANGHLVEWHFFLERVV